MKKIVAKMMVLLFLFSTLVACSGGKSSSTGSESASGAGSASQTGKVESLNIYGIYKSEAAYFVNEAAEAEKTLMELGEKYGIAGTWHFNNADGDPEKCMTLVETAIADNCDAIVICVPDQTMSQAVVDRCEEAGVVVVAVDDGLIDDNGEKIAPWVGIAAYEIGYSAGEWMADYATENDLLEDSSVGLLYMTMQTVSSAVPRTEGEEDAWAEKVGDALSDRTFYADFDSTQEGAYNSASALITGHPEIETWLVMVSSESGALGAGAALETSGLEKNSCVVSLGCDELVGQWEDGNYEVIRTAAYFSGKVIGREAMASIVEYFVNGTDIPLEYATPAVMVTAENYSEHVL